MINNVKQHEDRDSYRSSGSGLVAFSMLALLALREANPVGGKSKPQKWRRRRIRTADGDVQKDPTDRRADETDGLCGAFRHAVRGFNKLNCPSVQLSCDRRSISEWSFDWGGETPEPQPRWNHGVTVLMATTRWKVMSQQWRVRNDDSFRPCNTHHLSLVHAVQVEEASTHGRAQRRYDTQRQDVTSARRSLPSWTVPSCNLSEQKLSLMVVLSEDVANSLHPSSRTRVLQECFAHK